MSTKARFIFQMRFLEHFIIYHVIARNSTDARNRLKKYLRKDGAEQQAAEEINACLDLVNVVPLT